MDCIQEWLKRHREVVLVLTCAALLLIHVAVPSAGVDAITVYILLLATALLFGPELAKVLERIRRIEWNGKALELAAEEVGEVVAKLRSQAPVRMQTLVRETRVDALEELIDQTRDDPRAGFMLLTARLETAVRARAEAHGLGAADRYLSAPQLVTQLERAGEVPDGMADAFSDYWALRNAVIHDARKHVSDKAIWSLIETGLELEELLLAEAGTANARE